MSAITSPTPRPAREPVLVPPPVARPEPPRPKRWLIGVLLVAGVLAGALAYQRWLKPAQTGRIAPAAVPTAKATVGPLERLVRLSGTTSSINFYNIRAPEQRGPERSALVLLELKESGARVKKGDVIARIDGQGLKDHIDDVHSTVIAALADVKKRQAEQQIDWENLQQDVKLAKADLDSWRLEAGAAEIRTVIDREIINLAVEEAEAAYKQKLADLKSKKEAHAAELRILEITAERHKRHRDRHAYDLERYTILAPIDGMVVRQAIWRGGEMGLVQQGDQLYPGRLFLKVMDASKMQVEGEINQAESHLLRIGQKARIGLDAFPGASYEGRVASIGALAKVTGFQANYVRKIPVRIEIEGADERLIPDLSAYADVVIDRVDEAVRVPRAAVFEEAGVSFVYVKKGQKFEKRPVELGFRTYTDVAVVSGVSAGEEVALRRPETKP
jgi:multidrug efflux pump subunit AcrA (membrane-fusion protein)